MYLDLSICIYKLQKTKNNFFLIVAQCMSKKKQKSVFITNIFMKYNTSNKRKLKSKKNSRCD